MIYVRYYFTRFVGLFVGLLIMLILTILSPAAGLSVGLLFWGVLIHLLIKNIKNVQKDIEVLDNGVHYQAKITKMTFACPSSGGGLFFYFFKVRFFDSSDCLREEWVNSGLTTPDQLDRSALAVNDMVEIASYAGDIRIKPYSSNVFYDEELERRLAESGEATTLGPAPYGRSANGLSQEE